MPRVAVRGLRWVWRTWWHDVRSCFWLRRSRSWGWPRTVKTRDRLALGLTAGAGAMRAARGLLRQRRWMDLGGRVAIVTAADSGLGLILCRQLAEADVALVMAARDTEKLVQAASDNR